MVYTSTFNILCFLLYVYISEADFSSNVTILNDAKNELEGERLKKLINQNEVDTRRNEKKDRSTSSSSNDQDDEKEASDSLDISSVSLPASRGAKDKKKHYTPVSTEERRGWRKWHRKCTPCPKDMATKWRDYTIKWICGAYQRARRSFKSSCMMHYRNCQDGTMFVKIHDQRCANDTGNLEQPYGEHFFYSYKASLSGESSSGSKVEDSDSTTQSSESYEYD